MRIVIDLQACQSVSAFRGIGRYSKALALEMTRQAKDRGHDVWLVLTDNHPEHIPAIREAFEGLVPQEKIAIFPGMAPVAGMFIENQWRARAAEQIRERFIARLQPDVLHIASLFDGTFDNAVISIGRSGIRIPTVVTQYDLIPLVMPDEYFDNADYKRYYFDKLESLTRCDFMIAISESTKEETARLLKFDASRIVNISGAVDPMFKKVALPECERSALLSRYDIRKPYILYMPGGFDARKNFSNLFRAFAALPNHLRDTHQLVIGSRSREEERVMLRAMLRDASLHENEVIFTGYVPDDDLIGLYSECEMHVFPSLAEGFGLPALEAMACGAPSVMSNLSSLPEVMGRADALFDPRNPDGIRDAMVHVLTDSVFRDSLRAHASAHAKTFSWSRSANTALSALEAHFGATPKHHQDTPSIDAEFSEILGILSRQEISIEPTSVDLALLRDSVAKSHAITRTALSVMSPQDRPA